MFLKGKSSFALLCAASALYSGVLMSSPRVAFAETIEIGVDGTDKLSPVSQAIQKRLASKFRKISKAKKWSRGALVQYYADTEYQPIWVDSAGINNRAQSLLRVLERSPKYGLVSSDFKTKYATADTGEALTSNMLARIELELSLVALKYMDTARNGRFEPTKLSRFMNGTRERVDGARALEKLGRSIMVMAYLESYHPSHPQFRALKKELAALQNPATKTEKIIKVPSRGPTLKPGMIHTDVAVVRKRLKVQIPQNEGADLFNPALYDATLKQAVAQFQESKGLKGDGIVGRRTRMAMNEGIVAEGWRKEQLLANMERWRWLPDRLGENHILVNIPEYKVRVFSGGKVIHKERVIVGKIANKTPFFSDKMETVVFNPYWNVPQSIIANEMNYSVPRGYEGHYNNGMLHVRQPPGPRNALGKVKFLFPNKHAVYLHDTPSKSLFNSKARAFSHGCMRVRDPKRMAEVILSIGYKASSKSLVNRHWNTLKNAQLRLKHKIPIHVTYFTAWLGQDGQIKYFNDVYKHDKRIVTALNGGRVYLEPKQVIKKPVSRRAPEYYAEDDFWGYDNYRRKRFSSRSRKNQRQANRYRKQKHSRNNFWESSPKPRRQAKRNRRRSNSFDPFGLGW